MPTANRLTSDLPAHLTKILPPATRALWKALAGNLPKGAYLVGGTGIAAHLGHRKSRDLDFFMAEPFQPARLAKRIGRLGKLAVTQMEPGTLNCILDDTALQFLDARDQAPVEPMEMIGGIPVAGLGDLLATKLKVIGDRGELRDYFDIFCLETEAGRTVEEGLAIFIQRYRPVTPEAAVLNIVRGLGYFGDVADDPGLSVRRLKLERYWKKRQPEILKSLDRRG
ncbi:MAG: nucleotidyl transferase AbiEii/AbiGii toxin family protein [Actinomycetota bacterium]